MSVVGRISKLCLNTNKLTINILRKYHGRENVKRTSFLRKHFFPPLRNEDNSINHWNLQMNVCSYSIIAYGFVELYKWLEDPNYVLEEDAQEMESNGRFGTKKITTLDELRREYRIALRKRQEKEKQPSDQD